MTGATGPGPRAVLWHLLLSALLGAWSSAKCEVGKVTTLSRRSPSPWFSAGGGGGFGVASVPNPETPALWVVLQKAFPSFAGAQGLSAFLLGPRCPLKGVLRGRSRQPVFGPKALCRLYCRIWHSPPERRRLLEMWEGDAGKNREKMPKKNGLFRKCAGGSWRKLFLFLPMFR